VTPTYLHPDRLGSPRAATSASSALLWREIYDPFGVKLNGVADKIGYSGHAHDAETDFTYMQARFYDARLGRFLSTDPVDDGFSLYAYVRNDPINLVDVDGLQSAPTHSIRPYASTNGRNFGDWTIVRAAPGYKITWGDASKPATGLSPGAATDASKSFNFDVEAVEKGVEPNTVSIDSEGRVIPGDVEENDRIIAGPNVPLDTAGPVLGRPEADSIHPVETPPAESAAPSEAASEQDSGNPPMDMTPPPPLVFE
jgi:RHS repeat-associated protein